VAVMLEPEGQKRRTWKDTGKRVFGFLVSLGVALIVARIIEVVLTEETLRRLQAAQLKWIRSLGSMNPFSLTRLYVGETIMAWQGHSDLGGSHDRGAGYFAPLVGAYRMSRAIYLDPATWNGLQMLQLALGGLAFGTVNLRRTKGATFLLGHPDDKSDWLITNILFAAPAVVLVASLLAFGFQWLMIGALDLFSWLTGLAAAAAGMTGVGAVCWYCFKGLTAKGVEHVATPRL
jgi:hypothetical protein